jgi:hypothetical protein
VSSVWRLSSQDHPLFAMLEAHSVVLVAEAVEKHPCCALPIQDGGDPRPNMEAALVYFALSCSRERTALKTLMPEIDLLLVYLADLVNYCWQ